MDITPSPVSLPSIGDLRRATDVPMIERVQESIRRTYRNVELAVREGTMLIGHDGRIVESVKIDTHLGLDAHQLLGDHPLPTGWTMFDDAGDAVPADEHPALVAMRTGERVDRTLLYVYSGPEPRSRRLRFTAYPVADDPDVAVDLLICDDERRQMSRVMLEQQESRFRTMTDMLAVAVWESTTTGEVTYVNPKFTAMTGLTAAQTPDLPMLEIVHPDDLMAVMGAANEAADAGEYRAEYRLRHADGSTRWVTSRMSVLVDDDGSINGFVGTIDDIDDLHRSEQRSQRMARIVEAAGDAVAIFDDGQLTYLNTAGRSLLTRIDQGFDGDVTGYVPGPAVMRLYTEATAVRPADTDWTSQFRLIDTNGVPVDLDIDVTTEQQRGDAVQYVLMARDISEQRLREDALTHTATHDPLTGLANRQRLDDEFAACAPGTDGALLYLDLDHFKGINDEHGHAAGDIVLIAVADCLRAIVSPSALVARVGGDELIVWAPGVADPAALATSVVESIAELCIDVGESAISPTVTVGLALGTADDPADLLRRADGALYAAKRGGRGRWRLALD